MAILAVPNNRALCVIKNPSLRRRLRRSLRATGTMVEFCNSISDVEAKSGRPHLLFLDQESRRDPTLPHLLQVMDGDGKVVIIGESLSDNDFVSLMCNQPFDHVIGGVTPDENELVVTSVKLLTGDIFGIDKYLSWGVDIHSVKVSGYDEKRAAISRVGDFAKEVGTRRKVLARIENVVDELLMNALYDAPAAARKATPEKAHTHEIPASLSYACDGRFFGVSVEDYYGELKKQTILENLLRARECGGRPLNQESGAGLGIYFVLSSVSRYVANIDRGKKTEIICLFDIRKSSRDTANCTSSLNIFTSKH